MSDKMREEFEAWAVQRKGPSPWELPHFICFKNDDGTYIDNGANVAWESWKASRESLVIELPAVCAYEGLTQDLGALVGLTYELPEHDPVELLRAPDVRAAIEAADLKVKP